MNAWSQRHKRRRKQTEEASKRSAWPRRKTILNRKLVTGESEARQIEEMLSGLAKHKAHENKERKTGEKANRRIYQLSKRKWNEAIRRERNLSKVYHVHWSNNEATTAMKKALKLLKKLTALLREEKPSRLCLPLFSGKY